MQRLKKGICFLSSWSLAGYHATLFVTTSKMHKHKHSSFCFGMLLADPGSHECFPCKIHPSAMPSGHLGSRQPWWMNFDSCTGADSHIVPRQQRSCSSRWSKRRREKNVSFFPLPLLPPVSVTDPRHVRALSVCHAAMSTTSANDLPTISHLLRMV